MLKYFFDSKRTRVLLQFILMKRQRESYVTSQLRKSFQCHFEFDVVKYALLCCVFHLFAFSHHFYMCCILAYTVVRWLRFHVFVCVCALVSIHAPLQTMTVMT